MKFSTRKDADVTAEVLFDAVTDFDRIERMMIARGARLKRLDPAAEGRTAWDIGFDWRGRARQLRLAVTRHDRPEVMQLSGMSDAFNVTVDLTVVALTRARSRLVIEADIRPRNMKARLLVQTAKLGKGRLDKRFAQNADQFVDAMLAG